MLISVILPAKNEPNVNQLEYEIYNILGKNCEVLVQSEQGLSNAVWHGIQKAKGEIIAVLDADGSHPPYFILPMALLLNQHNHIVVGYKYINHETFKRKLISKTYAFITRRLLHLKVKDPLSGFLVGYKKFFHFKERIGFKFGLEVLLNNEKHVAEFPIIFRKRGAGKSKATPTQAVKTLFQILRLSIETRRILPKLPQTLKQAIGFAIVGVGGVIVNALVYIFLSQFSIFKNTPLNWSLFKEITWAWGIGILAGFIFNFALNKYLVFKT